MAKIEPSLGEQLNQEREELVRVAHGLMRNTTDPNRLAGRLAIVFTEIFFQIQNQDLTEKVLNAALSMHLGLLETHRKFEEEERQDEPIH